MSEHRLINIQVNCSSHLTIRLITVWLGIQLRLGIVRAKQDQVKSWDVWTWSIPMGLSFIHASNVTLRWPVAIIWPRNRSQELVAGLICSEKWSTSRLEKWRSEWWSRECILSEMFSVKSVPTDWVGYTNSQSNLNRLTKNRKSFWNELWSMIHMDFKTSMWSMTLINYN